MPGTNNFLQFNPAKSNQSNDVNYLESVYRSGGIPAIPGAAPSAIHNKLFYQVSTLATALAQMLANRNYNVSDSSLSDLINVLDSLADKTTVLALTGGVMTGQIQLSGEPAAALHAACKSYVDKRLPLAGGTMSGNLLLARHPQVPMEAATKQYVDNIELIPTGALMWFPASVAPSGFIVANGAVLSRTVYSKLWTFAQSFLVSEANWWAGYHGAFSAGDGATNFRLPSLIDRMVVGHGGTWGGGFGGGEINHTLTNAEMPYHNHAGSADVQGLHSHSLRVEGSVSDNGNPGANVITNWTGEEIWGQTWLVNSGTDAQGAHSHNISIGFAGGNAPHNNMPPFVAELACIKY